MSSLDRAWRNQSRLDALVGDQSPGVRQRRQDGRAAAIIADPPPSVSSRINGLPSPSQTACSLKVRPPLVRPMRWGTAPFLCKLTELRCALRWACVRCPAGYCTAINERGSSRCRLPRSRRPALRIFGQTRPLGSSVRNGCRKSYADCKRWGRRATSARCG
jgi:hypothetical protein